MKRNTMLGSKGLTYHGLSQTALATFRDFNKLAGDKTLNVLVKTSTEYKVKYENVPFVFSESNEETGRIGYIYIEDKYYLGVRTERYQVPETGENFEILKDIDGEVIKEPYRIIFGVVRVKVQLVYTIAGATLPPTNRLIFPQKSTYCCSTTTPANAEYFGNISGNIQYCYATAGQHAGAFIQIPENSANMFVSQIATNSDAIHFGNLATVSYRGGGGGSNNTIAVFAQGAAGQVNYKRVSFTVPGDAITHGTLTYPYTTHRGNMSASNSYNDRMLLIGGWWIAANPFEEDRYVPTMEFTTISVATNGAYFGDLGRASAYLAATCNGTNNKVVIIGAPNSGTAGQGQLAQIVDMTTLGTASAFVDLVSDNLFSGNHMAGCDGNQNRMVFQATIDDITGLMRTDMASLTNAYIFGSLASDGVAGSYSCISCPCDTNQ